MNNLRKVNIDERESFAVVRSCVIDAKEGWTQQVCVGASPVTGYAELHRVGRERVATLRPDQTGALINTTLKSKHTHGLSALPPAAPAWAVAEGCRVNQAPQAPLRVLGRRATRRAPGRPSPGCTAQNAPVGCGRPSPPTPRTPSGLRRQLQPGSGLRNHLSINPRLERKGAARQSDN